MKYISWIVFFSPILFTHTGHWRKWHPERPAKAYHGYICHQQGGWRNATLWWHWNFRWRSNHSRQLWICGPRLCNDAGSHLRSEHGLPQRAKILLRIPSESALSNGCWKAFPPNPWTKEQNRCWTVGNLQPLLWTGLIALQKKRVDVIKKHQSNPGKRYIWHTEKMFVPFIDVTVSLVLALHRFAIFIFC